jgi:deoxyribonuclease II
MTNFTQLSILALAFFVTFSSCYSCLDENQKPVNWFIALRVRGPANPRLYVIMDSSNKTWRETEETALVKPVFDQVNAITDLVSAWNDQPPTPKSPSITFAHSKGLIAYSRKNKSGVYYMHSIPKYPSIDTTTG